MSNKNNGHNIVIQKNLKTLTILTILIFKKVFQSSYYMNETTNFLKLN